MKKLWMALFVLLAGRSAFAAQGAPLWADLADIVTYAPKATNGDAQAIQDAIAKNSALFTKGGASFRAGMHFEYSPERLAGEDVMYRSAALMTGADGVYFYRKFDIVVGGLQVRKVTSVKVHEDVLLSTMHFQVNTGLIDRMVAVEDVEHDILLVFPLGVGGVDEGINSVGTKILTPRFQNATLQRKHVISKRSDHAYYHGEPFIPIVNAKGTRTAIAFHITILSDNDWANKGPNYLVRGFDSHGCMRLRRKDLRELYRVVMSGADETLPVNVDYFVWNRDASGLRNPAMGQVKEIHPYPVVQGSFMGVTNFGSKSQPKSQRGGDGLVIMSKVAREPVLSKLQDFSADLLMDNKVFEGLSDELDQLR